MLDPRSQGRNSVSQAVQEQLQGLSIFLIGMMGAGKSSVGQLLAQVLGYQFFDTDRVIEQAAGCSIAEIFERDGEAGFRALETQVLAELAGYRRLVIATGGGIVTRPMNWSHLRHGMVVWLDVPAAELVERLQRDPLTASRPLLQTDDPTATLEQLLGDRRELYAQADIQVTPEPGETAGRTAERVLGLLPTMIKEPTGPVSPA